MARKGIYDMSLPPQDIARIQGPAWVKAILERYAGLKGISTKALCERILNDWAAHRHAEAEYVASAIESTGFTRNDVERYRQHRSMQDNGPDTVFDAESQG